MNDDELLNVLQTSVIAADPAPATVRTAAIAASDWRTGIDALLAQRLVEAGTLRSDLAGIETDLRDVVYVIDDYELHLTIDTSGEATDVHGVLRPPTAAVTLHMPGRTPQQLPCTASGSFSTVVEATHGAIAFTTADGRSVRTPLIELSPPTS